MTVAAVAGTFSLLHAGHEALLERAFQEGDEVRIGLTTDAFTSSRKKSLPYFLREKALREYLEGRSGYIIFPLEDEFGPDELMDDVDVLVVSEETRAGGERVNSRRVERGLPPLRLSVVPVVEASDGSKISSTGIMEGRYGRNGDACAIAVAVGSLNPAKVLAVRSVMEKVYGEVRVFPKDVPSGVPDQPFGDQTRAGAINRAKGALSDDVEMAVGIEAGVFETPDGLYDIQYCCIASRDGLLTVGMGPGFRYPDGIAELVRKGMTVGDSVTKVYGETDIGKRQGAIGLLSKGLLDRKALTEQSVIAAMVPRLGGL
ncbi:MAG: inosine/xanthosine triphosphatase [Candidatus Methanomethylophilaceae archaeon]|nr:inosine/xanthosine triphosphatase [Candidatus Methanomethylophilaceae archaeon]